MITNVKLLQGTDLLPFSQQTMYCNWIEKIEEANDVVDTLKSTRTDYALYLVEHNSKKLKFAIMSEPIKTDNSYVKSSRYYSEDDDEDCDIDL